MFGHLITRLADDTVGMINKYTVVPVGFQTFRHQDLPRMFPQSELPKSND